MSISVLIRNYVGDTLARYEGVVEPLLHAAHLLHLPLLSGIDAYGVTQFNRLQALVVQAELETIGSTRADLLEDCRNLQGFAKPVPDEPHQYLVFIGD